MTAPDGFPPDMDPFALDAGTAERLVTGAVDVGDAPPKYRAVAATLSALREPPDGRELVGAPAAAERIAAVVVGGRAVRTARPSRRPASRARVLTACVAACGLVVTGGLAAAGALPDSAQRVASAVLDRVGISVPSGEEEPVDHEPTSTTPTPAPTPAGAAPSISSGVSPGAPPPATGPARPISARGAGPTDRYSPPADGTPPPAVEEDGEQQSAAGTPPGGGNGNAYGVGNGNANGHGNGNGNANGHGNGNGNGNADGHEDVQGAETGP